MTRPKHLPKRLTREEAGALLEQPNRRVPTGIRDLALLRVYYRCGLRCSEALDLKPRDLHLARNEIRVRGKGDKDRVVWADPTTIAYLERWRDLRPSSEWFFCTLKGGKLDDSHVRHMVARRARRAGIEIRVHPHMLRHSYASELLEEGFTISAVQKLLGHESLETTEIYIHLVDERLREELINRPG